jgi:hypothetical protein
MQLRIVLAIVLAACGGSGNAPPGDASSALDAQGGVGEPPELARITLYHNQVRAMVDTSGVAGGPLPALAWDPSLAATAAAWVARCQDSDGNGLVDHQSGAFCPWCSYRHEAHAETARPSSCSGAPSPPARRRRPGHHDQLSCLALTARC